MNLFSFPLRFHAPAGSLKWEKPERPKELTYHMTSTITKVCSAELAARASVDAEYLG